MSANGGNNGHGCGPVARFIGEMSPEYAAVRPYQVSRRIGNKPLLFIQGIEQTPGANHSQVSIGQNGKGEPAPFAQPLIPRLILGGDGP